MLIQGNIQDSYITNLQFFTNLLMLISCIVLGIEQLIQLDQLF